MESIGNRVKRAREEKNISIDEAYTATKVHPKILKAIEEDRFNDIPSALYLQGFIRKYADFLGLDSNQILEDFSKTFPSQVKPEYTLLHDGEKISLEKKYISTIFLYVIGLVAVLLVAFIIPKVLFQQKDIIDVPRVVSIPKKNVTKRVKISKKISSTDQLKLLMRCKADIWIQAKSDGKVIFQNILKKGTIKQLEANRRFDLWVGKAESLMLELNNSKIDIPAPGVVKGIVITHNGLTIEPQKK